MPASCKIWIFIFGVLVTTGCSDQPAKNNPSLRIAGAANLRFALEELAAGFTLAHGTPTEIILASSGKLTAQIKAGAPFDVFLSADERYPAALAAAGLTQGRPKIYARGPLAIWTTTSNIPLSPDSLTSHRISKVAIPNPATAPYGRAAMNFLQQEGLDGLLTDKLVLGESVGQANQFVYSRAAEIGITAAASVVTRQGSQEFRILKDFPPVVQSGVILSSSQLPEAADAFLNYVLSPKGQQTLEKFGYFTAE